MLVSAIHQCESTIGIHISWRRQWQPTPVLLPGKSHGQRSLVGCSPWVSESRTRLSDFTFTFPFHALEQEMATHSSVLAWRIPGTGEPGGPLSMGSHRVGHDWSDLAAAAAAAAAAAIIVTEFSKMCFCILNIFLCIYNLVLRNTKTEHYICILLNNICLCCSSAWSLLKYSYSFPVLYFGDIIMVVRNFARDHGMLKYSSKTTSK